MPDEVFGSGPVSVKFEYCGGWGYRKYAVEAMANMNAEFGEDKFTYTLQRDPKTSGRLEVTVYKNGGGEGELVHSKASSGKYIHADNDTFLQLVQQSIEWASAIRFQH